MDPHLARDLENKIGGRAEEINEIIDEVKKRIVPFIRSADEDAKYLSSGQGLLIPSSSSSWTTGPIYSIDNSTNERAPHKGHKYDHALGTTTPASSTHSGIQTPDGRPPRALQCQSDTSALRPVLLDPACQSDTYHTLLDRTLTDPSLDRGGRTGGGDLSGLLRETERILASSVNTFSQGFLDKLYGASNAPSIAGDLLLSSLNTNLHVRHVSPALTDIERQMAAKLADLIGWSEQSGFPFAGGVSQPGGSASNQLAVLIARAIKFPATRELGNAGVPGAKKLIIFTSAHSHYSIQKAAVMAGLGLSSVRTVPVDRRTGRMSVRSLERMITQSKRSGTEVPFFVNVTAGTTVLGSFDPIADVAEVTRREGLWCHVDGSWGGSVLISSKLRRGRLDGIERADSFSICPHKMLGVSVLCSFLIGRDVRLFKKANTLEAGYIFHAGVGNDKDECTAGPDGDGDGDAPDLTDLAELTPQCGRRGDSLKFYLSWVYYGGIAGYSRMLEDAFSVAQEMNETLASRPDLFEVLMGRESSGGGSTGPKLPCLQVCFFWVGPVGGQAQRREWLDGRKERTKLTVAISRGLVARGFMVDYAPMIEWYDGDDENDPTTDHDTGRPKLMFLRAVVNRDTARSTVQGLVTAVEKVCDQLDPTRVWS